MLQRIATLVTVCLILSGFGCGGKPKGTVSGKVTLDGTALKTGSVLLVGEDKKPRTAEIKPNGTYEVEGVPYGMIQVSVHSPEPQDPEARKKLSEKLEKTKRGKLTGASAVDPKDWVAIPERYNDLEKSGLSFNMDQDSKTFDILLIKPADAP